MKKNKLFVVLGVTLIFAFVLGTSSFATSPQSSNSQILSQELRETHAGYAWHHHDGNNIEGSFEFSVKSTLFPANEWTVKTSNFPSDALIRVDLYDPNNSHVNTFSVEIYGNKEIRNRKLIPGAIKTGKYRVHYNVFYNNLDSAPGNIEVWVY